MYNLDVIIAVGYRVSSYEGLSMVPLSITLGAYMGESIKKSLIYYLSPPNIFTKFVAH
ncbi:hypothetical protein ACRFAY_14070 [Bacteroides hominis]|uniref:virulence RhuM family protein n=1 Tax=Bacteroides TaxID=816 RepID=UPI00031B3858|nr:MULTISPECIES: virulence RhuM family protein [Bacteroides]MBV4154807.1 virulence RhuM family protein [Bacteroides fragilis]MCC2233678.1 virulence RhuM family protein [Bacteroides hominis (ex Afrizal et al. 2022)]MCE8578759.1 virulence RhuM family protein [Bacteroides fragilis]MCE8611467.1 virulence RhuM family protein [Bacteroides fragilis]MCE8650132.1 virulence RhuM family protein [Bacteroides fragilis]